MGKSGRDWEGKLEKSGKGVGKSLKVLGRLVANLVGKSVRRRVKKRD